MLTQDFVKDLFDYNLETGELVRARTTGGRAQKGDKAGTLDGKYLRVQIGDKKYYLHLIIWLWVTGHYPEYPKEEIDHINRNTIDNRFLNLRIVNRFENANNIGIRCDNFSGFKGVHYRAEQNRWIVQHKGKHIGSYESFEDAKKAKIKAEGK